MRLTKTTTASGIFGTGLTVPNAVVYAFRTDLAYRCIPYLATDGYWNVIVLKPQVAQEAAANVSVSGTVYYI